ncbi:MULTISPECIES: 3-oxoacyl-ACP synthase III family protein [unclassified Rhodococcus (in: high G+C Gram-positive bacteria)]|uniref:3-oxoacyl-ACP synthase III family protein n=1 Tax=unclassified Rhodococcus (in: high G+C Gram-positive bacteria) TaxID=192944 RepID=UPI00077A94AF|nr:MULTISPECIES: 3-oxoacyl-[acyl-carrier-protein] synthase III C-terminal domain-containing protein [unclassified Rhodococcus (in: high G+C Gram-positive bacteria)]KXX58842.1 3-oxoacyl-ACP synthase [Rhodococcus sp. LB1]PBC45513.1 3-oxoacyl-ACP synthase [Rhodococcus sp. ACPA1]
MGTVIDRLDVTRGGWRTRHSALHLAVSAAQTCLERAGRNADDLDLLVNVGLYRDRNLGEPALAALIQEDIGAHPEDPHDDTHGTFSFDVANGSCGALNGLQIVDGFLRSHTIDWALVVASDADPGRGMSEHFPFAPTGGAILCRWTDDDFGLGPVHWVNRSDAGESFCATVGLEDARNVLRFRESDSMDERFATAGAQAARECLEASSLDLADVDLIVAAPARRKFRATLAEHLGVPVPRIVVADDERMHTASLVAALDRRTGGIPAGNRVLIIAVGAGVTAGAALYSEHP